MGPTIDQDEKFKLRYRIGTVFTPSAPINGKALFAGRTTQVGQVINATSQRGQHVVIFGERGVGKTSLANVLSDFLQGVAKTILAPRVNCDTGDDFSSLWQKVFSRIMVNQETQQIGFHPEALSRCESMAKSAFQANASEAPLITPDDVVRCLTPLGEQSLLIVIIDEFDRLGGQGAKETLARTMMADTIKMMSDYFVKATLVIVGVGDSVNELISGHESVQRSLVQIHMPRMSDPEIHQIINRGMEQLSITIEADVVTLIARLSQGLPHYAHLLGLYAAQEAVDKGTMHVTLNHLGAGISVAVKSAQQSVLDTYHKAITSPRRDSLFPKVLFACARAAKDEVGSFAAADVRAPLAEAAGRVLDIPQFARHLAEFCELRRGPVLERMGEKHRSRFRFVSPLMEPYVIMKGMKQGWMSNPTGDEAPAT
jgi:Holliday junction resolvasome RuvABC ATP-dependent DNA helicase subunit